MQNSKAKKHRIDDADDPGSTMSNQFFLGGRGQFG